MTQIDSKIPQGPLAEKWTNYKNHQKLVNPAKQTSFGHNCSRYWSGGCFCCCLSG